MKRRRARAGARWKSRFPLRPDETEFVGSPCDNLDRLVEDGRRSGAFGQVEFDSKYWRNLCLARASFADSHKNKNLLFTVRSKEGANAAPMGEPFASFLKATLRLADEATPLSHSHCLILIRAGRELHDVLALKRYNPCEVDSHDFAAAETRCRKRGESQDWIDWVRQGLEKLADVINTYRLSRNLILYTPAYATKPKSDDPEKYLPSKAAMDALLAIASRLPSLRPSLREPFLVTTILNTAPFRISEVLALPADCIVFVLPDGSLTTEQAWKCSPKKVRPGLRFINMKTRKMEIKFLPSESVGLVIDIVRHILSETAGARNVAAYIEATGHPLLPEYLRQRERLTIADVNAVLGFEKGYRSRRWLKNEAVSILPAHIEVSSLRAAFNESLADEVTTSVLLRAVPVSHDDRIQLNALPLVLQTKRPSKWLKRWAIPVVPDTVGRLEFECALLRHHRQSPPDFPLRLSECLLVFPYRYFINDVPPVNAICGPMTQDHISRFLGCHKEKDGIFQLMGFTEPNGERMKIATAMFRRKLVTDALRRGLAKTQASRWANHKSDRAIEAYDRRQRGEVVDLCRQAVVELNGEVS